jgi:hypothetical protein
MFTPEPQSGSGGSRGPDSPVKIALVLYRGFSPNRTASPVSAAPSSCATGPGALFRGGGSWVWLNSIQHR